ncbi:AT-rich interactive domain-containing protein 5B-like [Sitophilus oryzae]|uniref:AT-rich interactive domain-containing protein 5B-like n=1 Tax=Sitophilus oryzae TaxID=7048 RepID=A0A6J2YHU5_SITOR|nr:AT-rich interactive domain-containing protein 5B-like [Sitophilus oryzae]
MDINDIQLIGGPCGQHGPYTFFKAFKYVKNGVKKIITLSEFFFVKMWRDSDLLCIGELQLLWIDKNNEQTLASLRLYFLPENTPEGRMDQGEDEVLAISEKVVIRVEDLITWIIVDAEWSWGRLAACESDLKDVQIEPDQCASPRKPAGNSFSLSETGLDYFEIEQERQQIEPTVDMDMKPHVVILSFPRYCRYRAMLKRLEGVENLYLKCKIVNALGGFYVKHPNTRVLFCRDTFDYPELEGHELLCNHLAPKLKGRPRSKRKKRSISPGSESNESESSLTNHYVRSSEKANGTSSDPPIATRRSTRSHENNENKEFMKTLTVFMKSKHISMGRVPSLGYKELNLHEFFVKVQKLGGYDCVTTNRLWKSVFDDMTGHLNSTSAATVIRRHYERFLLAYEKHLKGEEYKPLSIAERRRLKRKKSSNASSSSSDGDSSNDSPTPSTSRASSTPPPNESKELTPAGKFSSLRSIRVKPERQKNKQNSVSDKTSVADVNLDQSVKIESPEDDKESVHELIKSEPEDIQVNSKIEDRLEIDLKPECDDVQIKKEENQDVKEETESTPSEPTSITPSIPEGTKTDISIPDKNVEPLTSAVAPIAVTVIPDKILSPVEGKENIPEIKTGETVIPNVTPEITNVPYKAKTPNVEADDEYKKNTDTSFLQDVKKIKLDILKEGGLEVTPVRSGVNSPTLKDIRPTVIQPTSHLSESKAAKLPVLVSNPLPRRHSSASISHSVNITHVKDSTSTSSRTSSKSESFSFNAGSTPPKVVQSKSIYSYSEMTVYGNPKDMLQPVMAPQTPRFVPVNVRSNGGDPMDLSITSPQKPVVEIMRIPQSSTSTSYLTNERERVTKNLYKPSSIILDGRKLGSNLEITLVGSKSAGSASKSSGFLSKPSSHKRSNHEHNAFKLDRVKEDERMKRYGKYHIPTMNKNNAELTASHGMSVNNKPTAREPPMVQKPLPPSFPQTMPPFLSQFASPESTNGLNHRLMPLIDTLYYQTALQNVYSNLPNMPPPMIPLPTSEQLKFYAELIAHGRMNSPFPLPNGQSPLNNKKP